MLSIKGHKSCGVWDKFGSTAEKTSEIVCLGKTNQIKQKEAVKRVGTGQGATDLEGYFPGRASEFDALEGCLVGRIGKVLGDVVCPTWLPNGVFVFVQRVSDMCIVDT